MRYLHSSRWLTSDMGAATQEYGRIPSVSDVLR